MTSEMSPQPRLPNEARGPLPPRGKPGKRGKLAREVGFLAIDESVSKALEEGPEHLETRYQARLGEDAAVAREVVRQTMAMFASAPRDAAWGGYLVVDAGTSAVVGTCGFKSGPTADGAIEIAYFTFPEFEGEGYGSAMASRLMDLAAASSEVQKVIAHTLLRENASTRILEKLGMRLVGEVMDPSHRRVWRWEGETSVWRARRLPRFRERLAFSLAGFGTALAVAGAISLCARLLMGASPVPAPVGLLATGSIFLLFGLLLRWKSRAVRPGVPSGPGEGTMGQ